MKTTKVIYIAVFFTCVCGVGCCVYCTISKTKGTKGEDGEDKVELRRSVGSEAHNLDNLHYHVDPFQTPEATPVGHRLTLEQPVGRTRKRKKRKKYASPAHQYAQQNELMIDPWKITPIEMNKTNVQASSIYMAPACPTDDMQLFSGIALLNKQQDH